MTTIHQLPCMKQKITEHLFTNLTVFRAQQLNNSTTIMDWKNVMQFNKFAAVDALALSPSHQLLQRHTVCW